MASSGGIPNRSNQRLPVILKLGVGCIEWNPRRHLDWGKELKVLLFSVKMTIPWTRLQTLEKM